MQVKGYLFKKKSNLTMLSAEFEHLNMFVYFNVFRDCFGTFIPCSECTDVRFCSESCLQSAKNEGYHFFECSSKTKNTTTYFEDFLTKVHHQLSCHILYRFHERPQIFNYLLHPVWITI